MLKLIEFILCVFGQVALTVVSVQGFKLLDRKPFNCPLCLGFWIGIPTAFAMHVDPWWAYPFISAGTSWMLARWVTGDF